MPQNAFFMQPFEGNHVRFESTRSFDEVLLNLRKLVGTAPPQKVNKQESGGGTREQFEKAIQSQVGESDFMLFLEIDHGDWLPVFGIQRKVVRWILGNPLLAITMIRHDITAGLFVPPASSQHGPSRERCRAYPGILPPLSMRRSRRTFRTSRMETKKEEEA